MCSSDLDLNGLYEVIKNSDIFLLNAEQLWETTMNTETRTLMQVTVDHIMEEETNVRFRELMGSEVEHRRKFITEKAKLATNIDI